MIMICVCYLNTVARMVGIRISSCYSGVHSRQPVYVKSIIAAFDWELIRILSTLIKMEDCILKFT